MLVSSLAKCHSQLIVEMHVAATCILHTYAMAGAGHFAGR